nr:unnamed protein product [Callosobruchus chinensis]
MQDSSKGSVLKKASQLTNVPYKTLYKIIRNGVKTRKKRSNFGKFKNLNPTTAAKIRNIVYDCYKKRQIPTAEIAHKTLLEKGENSSRRTLQRWLRKIGFRFGTIDKKIMESRRRPIIKRAFLWYHFPATAAITITGKTVLHAFEFHEAGAIILPEIYMYI